MTRSPPQETLSHARSELEAAGGALDVAMSLIEVAPRADKIAISVALEKALERLRAARSELDELEGLISDSPALKPPT
jgi:hypothetical protein